jgi:dethiobiotin synthetase
MRIRPAMGDSAQVFGARFSNMNEATKDFLSTNPFVILEGKSLKGLTFRETVKRDMFDFLNVPGLSSFLVISSDLGNLNHGSLQLKHRILEESDVQTNVPISHLISICHEKNWMTYDLALTN